MSFFQPVQALVALGQLAASIFNLAAPKPLSLLPAKLPSPQDLPACLALIWHPAAWFLIPAAFIAQTLSQIPQRQEPDWPHMALDREMRNRALERITGPDA